MFPVIGFLPIMIIKSLEIIQIKWSMSFLDNRFVRIFAKLFWITNILFLGIVAFSPADGQISLYKKLYNDYKTPSTLYYVENNPYHRVLDINFYKRTNLDIVKFSSVQNIEFKVNRKVLFVTKDQNGANGIFNKELVYSTYPGWIKMLNFNNWTSRTNCWYVYELH